MKLAISILSIANLFIATAYGIDAKKLKQQIRADLYNGASGYEKKYADVQKPDYSKMSQEELEQSLDYQQSKCFRTAINTFSSNAPDIRIQNCNDVQNTLIALLKKDKEQVHDDWFGKLNKLDQISDDLETACDTQAPTTVPADLSRNELKELQSLWSHVLIYNQAIRVKECEEKKSECSDLKKTFNEMLQFEKTLDNHLKETK